MLPQEDAQRGLAPWLRKRVAQSARQAAERMDAEPQVALQTARTTLSWSLRHYGPDSALTVNAKREVAELLERSGRFDEALQFRNEVATSLRLQLGVDSPSTLVAEGFQGLNLERLGRHAEALSHFEHILVARTDALGRDDQTTLLAMDWLGCTYRSLGKLQESRRLLQEAVDGYQRQGAGESEDCMKTTSHLATTLFQLEEVTDACDLRRRIFEVRNRTLGPDDPATLSSLESLTTMLRWIDELEASHQNSSDKSVDAVDEVLAVTPDHPLNDEEPSTSRRVVASTAELRDVLGGRPGWRLETSLTPGVPPIWCFRSGGHIELSVAVDANSVQLYVRDTGAEILFDYPDELIAWLGTSRPEALQEPSAPPNLRSRFRKFGEWK